MQKTPKIKDLKRHVFDRLLYNGDDLLNCLKIKSVLFYFLEPNPPANDTDSKHCLPPTDSLTFNLQN